MTNRIRTAVICFVIGAVSFIGGAVLAHNYTWAHHTHSGVHYYQATLKCNSTLAEDSAANPRLVNYDPGNVIVYQCSTP